MKKVFSVLLAAILVFLAIPFGGLSEYIKGIDWNFFATKVNAASYSGNCGDNVNWTFDIGTGKLIIYGSGAMEDYVLFSSKPWYSFRSSVKSVFIQNGVTRIGDGAFEDCSNLISITIPDSITSIGDYAFYCCDSLLSVTLPNSITNIGEGGFCNCISLTSITIPYGVTILYDSVFSCCISLKSIIISESVTEIEEFAFENCKKLESVSIPNGVTYIGMYAFIGCESLRHITIPGSVKSIADSAFMGCSNLLSVTMENGVENIGGGAFDYCLSLNTIVLPESIRKIGGNPFYNTAFYNDLSNWCDDALYLSDNLLDVRKEICGDYTVKDGTKCIASNVFYGNKNLLSINIPDSVINVGDRTFMSCDNISAINVSPNNKFYSSENGVLFNKDKTEIIRCPVKKCGVYNIPTGVASVAVGCFYACNGLTSINIPDTVKSIGESSFGDCTGISSIIIPNGVTNIDSAFRGCINLTTVTIPESITSMNWAFSGCNSLASALIPRNVTEIIGTFQNCNKLISVVLPSGLVTIGNCTFQDCNNLKKLMIPESVTSIGEWAFDGCSSLSEVNIPNGVPYICDYTFKGCCSLKSITIPDSVKWLGYESFSNCTNLSSVKLGKGLTNIEYYAFEDCSNLIKITFPNSVLSVNNTSFLGCSSDLTFYGYKNSYVQQFASDNNIKFIALDSVPDAVTLVKITSTASGVKITWNATGNADGYIVYRKAGSATSWSRLAVVNGSATSYTDKTAKSGTTYTYTVKAQNTSGAGGYNKTGLKILYIAQPTVKVANKNGSVNVTWNKTTGAKGYYIYRKAGSETSWTKIATIKDISTVAYSDTKVKSGTSYKYTVKAYNGSTYSSYCSGIATRYLAQPTVKVANKNGYVNVTWGKISGAKGYYVYRKAGSESSWTKIASIGSASTVSYSDKNVKNGTTYKYTVKAYNGSYVSSYCSGVAIKYLTAGKVASASSAKAGITVKWGKNASADGYYVYRKVGSGSWSKIATVKGASTVSYLDKSAKKGTTYTYCVRPYNGSYSGTYTNTINCKDKY